MTGSRQQTQSRILVITVPSSVEHGGFTQILRQVVRGRSVSANVWREEDRVRKALHHRWRGAGRHVIMPVTAVNSNARHASLGRAPAAANTGEMVLKNLAHQLLNDEDELWIFKSALQHFRVTRSVASLCTSLRPLITSTERLMLLVELAQHLPSEALRKDFQKLCTLQFPKYHTFLRYFTPLPVTDGSKVIAKDASGQYMVANKMFDKNAFTAVAEPRPDTTSVHGGAESGFYSEQDDVSRHGNNNNNNNNGRGSVSSRAEGSPSIGSAGPSTPLAKPPRASSQSTRSASAKRHSISGLLNSGPLKILSGSFQSLSFKRKDSSSGKDQQQQQQKRILLARRSDGSLGVGIKGGKEYGTPIIVYVVEEGSQAELEGLMIGDRILDVNGTDFTHITHAEAVTMMRNAWNIIMTVESVGLADSGRRKSSGARSEEGGAITELEILVYPATAGKLGCAVNRDMATGDLMVKSVEKNSAACKAGLLKGDIILQIEGMVVNTLTEKQIATLTKSKRVRLTLRRKVPLDKTQVTEDNSYMSRSRKDTLMSDEVFSPFDFSLPATMLDGDLTFAAASTPRNPQPRSRSEDRMLASPRPDTLANGLAEPEVDEPDGDGGGGGSGLAEATTQSPSYHLDNNFPFSTAAEGQGPGPLQRIYRSRTMAVPPSSHHHHNHHHHSNSHQQQPPQHHQHQQQQHQHHHHHYQQQQQQPQHSHNAPVRNAGGGGVGMYNTIATRGRSLVRQPPPHQQQQQQPHKYTIVYSVRGRSVDTIVHPEVTRRPPLPSSASSGHGNGHHAHAWGGGNAGSQSHSSKMRYLRNRSRSRENPSARGNTNTLSSADRDLLQAVQSGVEKRQRALRLSLYQMPDGEEDDWKI